MRRTSVIWLRAEAFVILLAAVVIYVDNYAAYAVLPVWAIILVLLAPDLSFVGYAFGPRVGAVLYNAVHSYAAPFLFLVGAGYLSGSFADRVILEITGLWVMHIAFDRTLGYGLKETSGFKDTHLGRIGKADG